MALINGETMTVDGVLYTWNATTKQWTTTVEADPGDTFYVQELVTPAVRPVPVNEEE